MDLPLHAGDSHHDGHCPGPRRDFREGCVLGQDTLLRSHDRLVVHLARCHAPSLKTSSDRQVGGFLGYVGFPYSCPPAQYQPAAPQCARAGRAPVAVRETLSFLPERLMSKATPQNPPPPKGLLSL